MVYLEYITYANDALKESYNNVVGDTTSRPVHFRMLLFEESDRDNRP
jgi:hypothetical protein